MKKICFFLALILSGMMYTGCKDDDSGPYVCRDCVDEPEALAANDNSGKGIYKGLVLGSSGTIKLDIANSDGSISGVLQLDGKKYELHPEDGAEYVADEGFKGMLYGTMVTEDDIEIYFTANDAGTQYLVAHDDVVIPGHDNAFISVMKEKSTELVEIFEGTYSGTDKGTFNLFVRRNGDGFGIWAAVSRGPDGDNYFFEGSVEDDLLVGGGGGVEITGKIAGDNITGTWDDLTGDGSGTWRGRRTL